jgi:hypothetical protein
MDLLVPSVTHLYLVDNMFVDVITLESEHFLSTAVNDNNSDKASVMNFPATYSAFDDAT